MIGLCRECRSIDRHVVLDKSNGQYYCELCYVDPRRDDELYYRVIRNGKRTKKI